MREEITFHSAGTECAAWLYRPETPAPYPCVVMAHGFSAVRDQRLDAYAARFCAAGMAVFLFDYRHFGASAGEPRQLLSIQRQLVDWETAVSVARQLPKVDPNRIALFGSSFSGGHVQMVAAKDGKIAAVISQNPFCDGLKNLPALGALNALRLTLAGLRDVLVTTFGGTPFYIAAAGKPGSLAAMATPDALPGFLGMTADDSTWRNEVCARIALAVATYRPGKKSAQIKAPILYCIANNDQITPAPYAEAAAKSAPHAEVKRYDCGHFDVYVPPLWDQIIRDQTGFLVRHLRP